MTNFKVNDLIQITNYKTKTVRDCIIVQIHKAKSIRPHDYWKTNYTEQERLSWLDKALVKFDNNSTELIPLEDLELRDSELERNYRLFYYSKIDEFRTRIKDLEELAYQALSEAVKLSEEYSIPYHFSISPLSQSYGPCSLKNNFPDLDEEFIESVTGEFARRDGWQHSAVC